MSRARMRQIGIAMCSFAIALVWDMHAFAQTVSSSSDCPSWVDVKTGGKLRPRHDIPTDIEIKDITGGSHVYVWDPKTGSYIDVKTGGKLRPRLDIPTHIEIKDITGGRHVYVWVPCPSPTPAQQAGAGREKPDEQPNPLRKVLQNVNIGIGVSGGHTAGHDDHKGDRRVTDQKHTKSTTKKLPAGCKCHPCTCSPCKCH